MLYTEFLKRDWNSDAVPVKKEVEKKFSYEDNYGKTIKIETNRDLFFDEYWNVHRHRHISAETALLQGSKFLKTSQNHLSKIPNFREIKLSKHWTTYAVGDCPFKDHTGAGHGGAKVFKKPVGEKFGIEIEMCFPDNNNLRGMEKKVEFAYWIQENYPEWICERDGSLEDACHQHQTKPVRKYENHNLELVSPPLSYEEFEKCIPVIIDKAKELGAEGRKIGDWYGAHFTSNIYGKHVRKSAARFIYTMNQKKYRNFWRHASGRPKSTYLTRYAPFLDALDIEDCLDSVRGRGDHYMAAYPRNENGGAVEARIFISQMNADYFLAILELIKHLTDYSLMKEPEDWIEYVKSQCSDNLSQYLIASGAITVTEDE